ITLDAHRQRQQRQRQRQYQQGANGQAQTKNARIIRTKERKKEVRLKTRVGFAFSLGLDYALCAVAIHLTDRKVADELVMNLLFTETRYGLYTVGSVGSPRLERFRFRIHSGLPFRTDFRFRNPYRP